MEEDGSALDEDISALSMETDSMTLLLQVRLVQGLLCVSLDVEMYLLQSDCFVAESKNLSVC